MKVKIKASCKFCGKEYDVEVDAEGYRLFRHGKAIEHALPDLSDDDRELLISEICPTCWKVSFPNDAA